MQKMKTAFNLTKIKQYKGPLLVLGESGVGKSHFVKKLFSNDRFLNVHAPGLTETLFESELFGHKKGSFTGAFTDKIGFLEKCIDGILFLDEISELSLGGQKKLLKLLDDQSFYKVGCTKERRFRGKLVFATNQSLKRLVEQGKFRKDLYFRLSACDINLRPLRQRTHEIRPLVELFLKSYCNEYQKEMIEIDDESYEVLTQYQWPGNIRELKNFIHTLVAFNESGRITKSELNHIISQEKPLNTSLYCNAKYEFEKRYFQRLFNMNHGKINSTIKASGLSKATVLAKAKKYGINTGKLRAEFSMRNISEF